MTASTITLRYPNYINNDLIGLIASLVPTPRCHFLIASLTPLSVQNIKNKVRKTSVTDVMRRLFQKKNITVSCDTKIGAYISMVNIIQGNINPGEVKKSIRLIKKKKNLKFIPWAPSSIKIILTRQSPLIQHQHRVSGLMIANHTNMSSLFKEIIKSYNYLKRRNAFIDNFTKFRIFNDDLEEFNSCKEIVEILIDEYTAMLKSNYVS